jgi:hypothetical protein
MTATEYVTARSRFKTTHSKEYVVETLPKIQLSLYTELPQNDCQWVRPGFMTTPLMEYIVDTLPKIEYTSI